MRGVGDRETWETRNEVHTRWRDLIWKKGNKILPHMTEMEAGLPGLPVSHPLIAVVREAASLGITLSAHGFYLDWSAPQEPPAAFLDRLRQLKPELMELLQAAADPPVEPVGTAAAWTDDRAWIAEIVRAATTDEKLAALFSWVIAAGGWIEGTTALLPTLPHRLATRELHRMLRQSRIEIRETSEPNGGRPVP